MMVALATLGMSHGFTKWAIGYVVPNTKHKILQ
jgi:hypothetical protein